MVGQLQTRFERSQSLYMDLVGQLGPDELGSKLGDLRSNSIGEQLWCVVGARHSYAKAAKAGSWQGFSSPLTGEALNDPAAVLDALRSTFAEMIEAAESAVSVEGETYVLDLLEHEAQHHGQLIRYLYALGIERPASWKERYALE